MNWIVPVPARLKPAPPPCVVLCDPDSDLKRCGAPAGEHTILDWPLCDQCYEAIRL